MCNIFKTADRRAKQKKIWDSKYSSVNMLGTLMPDSLSLVCGHSVHIAKFPLLRFSKLFLSQFSSDFNQTLLYVGYEDIYGMTFLGRSAKN